jgi:uncharacterized protein DUF1707
MRAGDRDRQAVADQLKTALDEGRLDLGEYDERLQRTYAAKTFTDLDGLLDDLPGTVPVQHAQVQPLAAAPAPVPAAQPSPFAKVARWAGPYGGVIAVCVAVWAISSVSSHHLLYFWPIWMIFPLILGAAGQWRGDGRRRDRRRR